MFPALAGMNRSNRYGSGVGIVFPALAGMNRLRFHANRYPRSVPRARGDEPDSRLRIPIGFTVFPALAGMNRVMAAAAIPSGRVPRARGDEPVVPSSAVKV